MKRTNNENNYIYLLTKNRYSLKSLTYILNKIPVWLRVSIILEKESPLLMMTSSLASFLMKFCAAVPLHLDAANQREKRSESLFYLIMVLPHSSQLYKIKWKLNHLSITQLASILLYISTPPKSALSVLGPIRLSLYLKLLSYLKRIGAKLLFCINHNWLQELQSLKCKTLISCTS